MFIFICSLQILAEKRLVDLAPERPRPEPSIPGRCPESHPRAGDRHRSIRVAGDRHADETGIADDGVRRIELDPARPRWRKSAPKRASSRCRPVRHAVIVQIVETKALRGQARAASIRTAKSRQCPGALDRLNRSFAPFPRGKVRKFSLDERGSCP